MACTARPLEGSTDGTTGATTSTSSSPAPVTTSSAGTGTSPGALTTSADTAGTSASTDGGTDEGTTTNTDDCQHFICPPDLPPNDGKSCQPSEQNCAEGEKCVWYVAPGNQLRREAARCIPVTGDRAPFEPCNLPFGVGPEILDDCGPDSYCLEVYETADHGFCAPYMKDWSCDHIPGSKGAVENGSDFPYACLHYECNPLDPSICPDDMQCTFYPAWLYGVNHCWHVPPGDLPLGAACDYGECGPGKLCLPAEYVPDCAHERCCTAWCDLGAPQCDDPGAACEAFGWSPELAELGVCVVPGSW